MNETYLEITFRHDRPLAAYLYLPRQGDEKGARTEQAAPGLLIDFTADGRPIGLEITALGKVSAAVINEALRGGARSLSEHLSGGGNSGRGPKWLQYKGLEGRQSELTRSVRCDCDFYSFHVGHWSGAGSGRPSRRR